MAVLGRQKLLLLALISVLLMAGFSLGNDFRNCYVALYGPAGPGLDTLIAERYNLAVEGRCSDLNVIRRINPEFMWFHYISIEDMPPEGSTRNEYYTDLANLEGVNPETFFMHYKDFTQVTIQGTTLSFPGLDNAVTRNDTINSRIPIYYANRTRFLQNLYSPPTRRYQIMYACSVLTAIPRNYNQQSTVGYYDGIFWDNGSYCLYNVGSLVSGGHIYEHPTNAAINTIGCSGSNWWWEACLSPFYQELMDTLATSPNWAPDNQQKYSMPNIANSWTNDYVYDDAADFFSAEFVPRWDLSQSMVLNYYRRDSLAHAHGSSFNYAPIAYTTLNGIQGSYTYSEALMNNLCLFYSISSPSAYIFHVPHSSGDPSYPGWDTLVWCGAMDYNVGERLETKYQIAATGTDGRGYNYTILSRQYQNAKVFFRPHGNYNEHFDQQTAVNLNLGGTFRELLPHGGLSNPINSATFRNGQGRIMVPATGDTIPPAPIDDLGAVPGLEHGTVRLTWTETGDDGENGQASYTVVKYSTGPINESNWYSAYSVASPPSPSIPGQQVNYIVDGMTAGRIYYLAVQTYDESGNGSGISNVPDTFACGILTPAQLSTETDDENNLAILTSSVVESYLSPYYVFALDSTESFPEPNLALDLLADTVATAVYSDLSDEVSYFWRVCAVAADNSDSSAWSPAIQFNLITGVENALASSDCVYPPNGANVYTSRPFLEVNNLPAIDYYYFQISDSYQFSQPDESGPVPKSSGSTTRWQVNNPLEAGPTYYWRVSSNGAIWTSPLAFTAVLDIHPYPNPFRASEGHTQVIFTNLVGESDIKITTLSGDLVIEQDDIGPDEWSWNVKNSKGEDLAPGIYLYVINFPAGSTNGKLLVIR